MLTSSERHRMVMYNSAKEIEEMVQRYTVEELSTNMLLTSEDVNAMKLLRWYERLILLCKLDFDRYSSIKVEEHFKIAQFLKENNLYHCWAELLLFVVRNSDTNKQTNIPMIALFSEMSDTWLTFSNGTGNLMCGVSRDGKELLFVKDQFHGWADDVSELTLKLVDKKISEKNFLKKLPSKMPRNREIIESDERDVNRILVNMIPYINERTLKCLPTNWVSHSRYELTPIRRYFPDGDLKYLDMLHNRKYSLNSKGVTARFKNAGKIREIFFMEDITPFGEFYCVFKATFIDGKETCGVISPNKEALFMGFNGKTPISAHSLDVLYLFVLEVYSDLTCDFEKSIKRLYALKEVETFDDPTLNNTNIYVIYDEYIPPEEKEGSRKGSTQKSHMRKYAIRKLSEGQEASKSAIERARALGIELKPGETFVRPYWVGRVREEINNKG